jgi:PIN domain nuclease of toxin-antitoxin system
VRPKAKRRYVLDASALLAYLQREPGYQRVRAVLDGGAVMSAVNLAEVYSKVVAAGLDLDETAAALRALGLRVIAFLEPDAYQSALLYRRARALGLSLADRAWPAPRVARRHRRPRLDPHRRHQG